VVKEHAGQLPGNARALRELKGIGRYTAGALASIAFDQPEPLVDGNVIRVLARLLGIREDVGERSVAERFWEIAAELVRGPRPGDLNQALMELGATLCTPRHPRCPLCPLRKSCDAADAGDAEQLPRKTKRAKARAVEAVAAWIERSGRVLAVKRPEGGLLGGLWELPGGDVAPNEEPEAALRRCLAERLGLSVPSTEAVGSIEHLFTHRRLRLHVYRCGAPTGRVRRTDLAAHRWLAPRAIAALPHGGPTRKALALLGQASPKPHRQRMRQDANPQPAD
jgi:A/G-specific adenine glycosylase